MIKTFMRGPAQIIPIPEKLDSFPGKFVLKHDTVIFHDTEAARHPAEMLAAYLRPATGYEFRVCQGTATPGGMSLSIQRAPAEMGDEGYELCAKEDGVIFEESDFQTAIDLYRKVCDRLETDQVFTTTPDLQRPMNTLALINGSDRAYVCHVF